MPSDHWCDVCGGYLFQGGQKHVCPPKWLVCVWDYFLEDAEEIFAHTAEDAACRWAEALATQGEWHGTGGVAVWDASVIEDGPRFFSVEVESVPQATAADSTPEELWRLRY